MHYRRVVAERYRFTLLRRLEAATSVSFWTVACMVLVRLNHIGRSLVLPAWGVKTMPRILNPHSIGSFYNLHRGISSLYFPFLFFSFTHCIYTCVRERRPGRGIWIWWYLLATVLSWLYYCYLLLFVKDANEPSWARISISTINQKEKLPTCSFFFLKFWWWWKNPKNWRMPPKSHLESDFGGDPNQCWRCNIVAHLKHQ